MNTTTHKINGEKFLQTKKQKKVLAASAVVLAFLLSACGGGGGSSAPSGSTPTNSSPTSASDPTTQAGGQSASALYQVKPLVSPSSTGIFANVISISGVTVEAGSGYEEVFVSAGNTGEIFDIGMAKGGISVVSTFGISGTSGGMLASNQAGQLLASGQVINANIYRANILSGSVTTFPWNSPGATTLVSGLGQGSPSSLAVDQSGNVWITMGTQIKELSPVGAVLQTVSLVSTSAPMGIVIDQSGTIYFIESNNENIYKLVGGVPQKFATLSSGASVPVAITIDPTGSVYVLDVLGNIYKISPTGISILIGEVPGATSVAVAPSGNVYVGAAVGAGAAAILYELTPPV